MRLTLANIMCIVIFKVVDWITKWRHEKSDQTVKAQIILFNELTQIISTVIYHMYAYIGMNIYK